MKVKNKQKLIDLLYNQYFINIQVDIMDIGKISDAIAAIVANTTDEISLKTQMEALVAQYRKN